MREQIITEEEAIAWAEDPRTYIRLMETIQAEVEHLQKAYDRIAEDIERAQERNGMLRGLMYRRIRNLKEISARGK